MGARRQTRATQCLGQGSLRRRPVWRRRGVAEHGGLASLGIVKHNLAPARWRRRSVGGRPSPSRERSAPRPGRFCSAVCAAGAPSRSVRPRFRLPAFGHWPHHAEPVPSPRQHVEEARFAPTLLWREVDSNPRSLVGERVIFVFAKGKRATETTRGDLETDEHLKRDRGFESVFLQR